MPITDHELKEKARAWHKRQTLDLDIPAIIQESSDLPAGQVRVYRTDIRQTVIVGGVIRQPGTEVWLREMKNHLLQIFAVNVDDSALVFGDAVGTVTTPPVVGAASGTVWEAKNLSMGLVRPWAEGGYGLFVYVEPFVYRDRIVGGALAVTLPASAGERYIGVVYYDYSAAALGIVYGTASTLPAGAWSLQDAVSIALGDTDRIRLDSVLLTNGITSVTYSTCTFYSTREFLVLGGVQPGDTLSNITLVNTRELVESDNSGSTYTIDLTLGNVVALTLTADCTLTFPSSLDTGYAYSFTLKTIQDGTGGRDLTFPGSVSWIPNSTPAPNTDPDTIAYYTFVTEDGGTSWDGFFNGDSVNGAPTGATEFTQLTDVPASYSGHSLDNLRVNAGETALEFYTPSSGSGVDVIHLQEQQSSGTNGGNFTSGAWRTRVLNTEVADVGGHCSLSSNQFTLDAGTYVIKATAPAFLVNQHQLKLYNISDSADVLLGVNEYAYGNATYGNAVAAHLDGVFTIASSKTFELQHRCATTRNTDGFGIPTSWGTEVYADVLLLKIS